MSQDIEEYFPGLRSNEPITIDASHITGNSASFGKNVATKTVATTASGYSADYYTGDYASDGLAIQAAIDAVFALGGGKIFIRAGTYTMSTDVHIRSNIIIEGEGEATKIIIAAASPSVSFTNRVLGTPNTEILCSNVKFLNFKIDATAQNDVNRGALTVYNIQNFEMAGMHINAYGFAIFMGCVQSDNSFVGLQDTAYVWIHHNYLTGQCRQDIVGGGNNSDLLEFEFRDILIEHNFLVQDANGGGTTNFNAIDNTPCRKLQFSNNIVQGNLYFGNERDPHYLSTISNNVVRPPANSATMMCGITIQDENSTGDVSGQCMVNGNIIYGGGIHVSGRSGQEIINVNVVGNTIINDPLRTVNDQTGTLSQNGVRIVNANNCSVTGNMCYGPAVTGSSGIVCSAAANCLISGNYIDGYFHGMAESGTVSGNVYTNNYLINYSDTPTTAIVTGKIHNNFGVVTENTGTATVANGSTTIVVTHGLAFTPVAGQVMVTATNSMGNATKFRVGTYTSTQFTITVDQDPGATTATFAWLARE